MMGLDKLRAEHKQRRAFVYVRQSTMAQVHAHRSSTERQCDLAKLAVELGWETTHVEVVLGDLGRSGKFSEDRDGFQRLVTEVSLGRAGAIFATEVSRLARSSADWHRLIEIAGLTRTVLLDEHAVFEPRDPNDRLVLGMKGTMAEFELVWLRQRMDEGKRHLARQGRLRLKPPVGYVFEGERMVLDPNEEVRRSVSLLLERYRASASCLEVVRYFREHALRFPARQEEKLIWGPLTRERVRRILTNPRYAGAYVHGRTRTDTVLDEGRRRQRRQKVPTAQWPVLLQGVHPAYLSWEEFMANQKRLSEHGPSRRTVSSPGAPGGGGALLSGMLICGRCGSRLTVSYGGSGGRYPTYVCRTLQITGVGKPCMAVTRRFLDEPAVAVVLGALTREQLRLATDVVDQLEQQDAAVEQQWKLRLEHARYEAKRAERQYDACDPENRVVARTLEKRWNDALVEVEELEREHEETRLRRRIELNDLDRQRISELAGDIRKLWRADTTTDRDRKALLRMLLEQISVTPIDIPHRALRLRLLWHTQAVTEVEVIRPGSRGRQRTVVNWRIVSGAAPSTPAVEGGAS